MATLTKLTYVGLGALGFASAIFFHAIGIGPIGGAVSILVLLTTWFMMGDIQVDDLFAHEHKQAKYRDSIWPTYPQ